MELTLKRLLEKAEFTQVKKGGYDRDEVNEFLDRAVAMATKVEAKLTQTMEQARSAAPEASGPSSQDIEAEVQRRVEAALAEHVARQPQAPVAVEPVGPSAEEAAEEAARTLVLAQRTADAAVREAREDAARIISEANKEADSARSAMAAELERERVDANSRVRTEISELESARESLRTDVGVLERHVEEQRNQLRSSVGELQRLLDDPAGFRLAPTPALIDPQIPADDPDPVIDLGPSAEAAPTPVANSAGASDFGPAVIVDAPEAAAELSFGDVHHAPPAGAAVGEPTQPVPVVDPAQSSAPPEGEPILDAAPPVDAPQDSASKDEDPFMAELRKAMNDDEPLGPRDPQTEAESRTVFGDRDEGKGWRFGRR